MKPRRREKIKLKILKEFSKGNFKVNCNTYNISTREFNDIILHMKNENLIDIHIAGAKTKSPIIFLDSAKLTSKGIKYLEDNNFKIKVVNPTCKVLGWCIGTGMSILGIYFSYLELKK